MKRLTNLLAITLLTSCVTAFAQEQEETTTEKSAVEQSADIYADGYNKFRFGGYGEILANFMDYGINRFRGTEARKIIAIRSPYPVLSWLSITNSIPNGY